MIQITKSINGNAITIALRGRLDTETSPDLDDEIAALPELIDDLTIDMDDLEYVSSSGLRVLLTAAQKMANCGGSCTMANVPELVMEVFEMTGLTNVFTIV